MKKSLYFLTIFFGLSLQSCFILDEVNPKEKPVAEAIIGISGGILEASDLRVEIPSGTFTNTNELKIGIAKDVPTELNAVGSQVYVLEGLPLNFQRSIRIKIKNTNESKRTMPMLAVGEEVFVPTLNKSAVHYQYITAQDSAGYMIATLPITDELVEESEANARVKAAKAKMYLISFDGNFSIDTPQGHFRIFFPYLAMRSDIEKLGGYLENAYSTFKGLDFSYSKRSKWPVNITVKTLEPDVFGYAVNSVWGNNYGWIEFNAQKITDASEMKLTSGHEFLHLVQGFYDNRNRYSRAKSSNYAHFWLDEATAVWSEKLFSGNPNYVSTIRNGHQMAPFNGFQKGANENPQHHGYGMAAVVKYLTTKNGDKIIKTAYENIKNNKHPVSALSPTTPFVWWDSFFKDYMEGKVYDDVGTGMWLTSSHGLFDIAAEKDTVKEFTKIYADYSAALYRINLKLDKLTDNANLVFTIPTDADSRVMIFRTSGTTTKYLGSSTQKVTLNNVKTLQAEKGIIFAVVLNTSSRTDYLGEREITLKVKLNNLELDPNLFGKWVFEDNFWQFNPDGTLIQHVTGKDYHWNWVIENGRLKLFVPNGKPAYFTYKIENNKLFFYVESLDVWSAPMYKM